MSDAEIEQKREEDERLDTAEDPNEEVRTPFLESSYKRDYDRRYFLLHSSAAARRSFLL